MIKITYTSPPYAKLLNCKIANTTSIHPQKIKTPSCYMPTLSLSKATMKKRIWAMKKRKENEERKRKIAHI
jgi:hypothetical protein